MFMDVVNGVLTFSTTYVLTTEQSNPWTSLLISLISAVVYALLSYGLRTVNLILQHKGLISKEQSDKLDDIADDIGDNGKLDDSNKE